MGIVITLIILVMAVMLIFFKKDILNENTILSRLSETGGFVVCVVTLVIIYIINR